jgi:hypothetical protein
MALSMNERAKWKAKMTFMLKEIISTYFLKEQKTLKYMI